MSIINDALKKVQNSIDNDGGAPEPAPGLLQNKESPVLPSPRIRKSLLTPKTTLAAAAPKTAFALNPSELLDFPKHLPSSQPSTIRAASAVSRRQVQSILIGAGSTIGIGSLVLIGFFLFSQHGSSQGITIQGIMTRGDKNVALINDEIYEAGQTVMGKKILEISLDNVQIKDRGRIKNFPVQK